MRVQEGTRGGWYTPPVSHAASAVGVILDLELAGARCCYPGGACVPGPVCVKWH